MALSLKQLESEFAGAPLVSPYGWPLTRAILLDVWRLAGRAPPPPELFGSAEPAAVDRLGVLAHLLVSTSLGPASVEALRAAMPDPAATIPAFLEAVSPLTAEMVRANAFRREELVRRWLQVVGAPVAGETPEQSRARVEQLDYRKTLVEYAQAEKARAAEAERRAQLLREAQERENAARGWRE